jgi:hypothetical protein
LVQEVQDHPNDQNDRQNVQEDAEPGALLTAALFLLLAAVSLVVGAVGIVRWRNAPYAFMLEFLSPVPLAS